MIQSSILPFVFAQSDTNQFVKKPIFSKAEIISYSGMLTYGALTIRSPFFHSIDEKAHNLIAPSDKSRHLSYDNYLQFSPALITIGLESAGIQGKHKALHTIALYGMSNILLNTVVAGTKEITHKKRPNGLDYLSFPSGHTAEAFASAELMRLEYKDRSPWFGIAGYTMAVATGYLRMYNNRHWFGDVLAGAAIGIMSTRLSYWAFDRVVGKMTKGKKITRNSVDLLDRAHLADFYLHAAVADSKRN